MSESKRKQYSRRAFLAEHKWCVYCGAAADTTDHCPPRCFFKERKWPESYEFPACGACNREARLDEQALAVLVRCELGESTSAPGSPARREWEHLVQGVRNNQPHIITEWLDISPSRSKRSMRQAFGEMGDGLRHAGWGVVNIGSLTQAAIERFTIKLAKSLYYLHNGALFEGVLYARHLSMLTMDQPSEILDGLLKFAPHLSRTERGNQSLADQFLYRFNHSPDHGALHAVARFSPQFMMQLIMMTDEMAERLAIDMPQAAGDIPGVRRYRCLLKHRPPGL